MQGYGYNIADKNHQQEALKRTRSRKKYKLKKVREFMGVRQRTRPRVAINKSKAKKRAPGPATYNSIPNGFGKQFRVGKGLSSPKMTFSTAPRFAKDDKYANVYTLMAKTRPASATASRKKRRNKNRKTKSNTQKNHRPKSAPGKKRSSSTSNSSTNIQKYESPTRAPGPQCYVHKDEGIGHQRVSQRKTSPAVGFGKAKRNINLRSLTSSSDRPENIPGPVDYNTLRSSVKLMRRRPSTDFGTSSRFEY